MSSWIHFNRLSFLCVAVAALAASSSASANYYALLANGAVPAGDADQGAYVQLYTDVLWAIQCTQQFVNHEMWYGMAPGRWAEVGVTYGYNTNTHACEPSQVFWAQSNTQGYTEFFPGTNWSYDSWQWVYVERTTSTSCSWYVFFSANQIGTSSNNCAGTGRSLFAGIEATTTGNGVGPTPGAYARGWMWAWERKDSTATWYDGWDGAGLSSPNPPSITWWDEPNDTETEEVLNETP